jgi:hypothetical protein
VLSLSFINTSLPGANSFFLNLLVLLRVGTLIIGTNSLTGIAHHSGVTRNLVVMVWLSPQIGFDLFQALTISALD